MSQPDKIDEYILFYNKDRWESIEEAIAKLNEVIVAVNQLKTDVDNLRKGS